MMLFKGEINCETTEKFTVTGRESLAVFLKKPKAALLISEKLQGEKHFYML